MYLEYYVSSSSRFDSGEKIQIPEVQKLQVLSDINSLPIPLVSHS